MSTKIKEQMTVKEIEQLKKKASFFDEFMEFIEDKGLGRLMQAVEKEENISLKDVDSVFGAKN